MFTVEAYYVTAQRSFLLVKSRITPKSQRQRGTQRQNHTLLIDSDSTSSYHDPDSYWNLQYIVNNEQERSTENRLMTQKIQDYHKLLIN